MYSAGVTDSALTVHGRLQAERLAKFFADRRTRFSYIFSSDLQRTFRTATAISQAQRFPNDEDHNPAEVRALAILREQDFGHYEGKPFGTRPRTPKGFGNEEHLAQAAPKDLDFKDVESKESLSSRAENFMQEFLIPIIHKEADNDGCVVAIVSHGILLSHLWRTFLELLPRSSIALSPEATISNGSSSRPIEYLGGWSNTGFLEILVLDAAKSSAEQRQLQQSASSSPGPSSPSEAVASGPSTVHTVPNAERTYDLLVTTINGKDHLKGLKRTRGGVGSSKDEEGQKSIDNFFKKRRV